eukprot:224164-Prymnesium_polylepis.1
MFPLGSGQSAGANAARPDLARATKNKLTTGQRRGCSKCAARFGDHHLAYLWLYGLRRRRRRTARHEARVLARPCVPCSSSCSMAYGAP